MKRLLLLLTICVTGCNYNYESNYVEYDYSDVDKKIAWDDIFIQVEDYYLIYFYRTTCAHCNELKQEIIKFYFDYSGALYFVEANECAVYGKPSDLTHVASIENFYIFGTPFLIEVEKLEIKNYYAGAAKIREFITYLK